MFSIFHTIGEWTLQSLSCAHQLILIDHHFSTRKTFESFSMISMLKSWRLQMNLVIRNHPQAFFGKNQHTIWVNSHDRGIGERQVTKLSMILEVNRSVKPQNCVCQPNHDGPDLYVDHIASQLLKLQHFAFVACYNYIAHDMFHLKNRANMI